MKCGNAIIVFGPLLAGCSSASLVRPDASSPPAMISIGEPAPTVAPAKEICFGEPTPCPLHVTAKRGEPDEWDFLQPAAKLAEPGQAPSTEWTTLRMKK